MALTDERGISSPSGTSSRSGTALRVLVVDDNVDAAESLGMLLQLQDHEVRIVHDGLDALDAVRESMPDTVLLDLGLPGLDGYSVAEQIRTEATLRQPRPVALTGWGRTRIAGAHLRQASIITSSSLWIFSDSRKP